MAAHLPGMCAAIFPMPVIGIPMTGKVLDGQDALYSHRSDAAWNSGCDRSDRRREECGDPCGKDSATSDPELLQRLKDFSKEMKEEVEAKAERLAKLGHKEYMAQKAAK